VQGGSTITQELVRNLYIGNPQRTLSRKVKEACLAEKLFQRHSRKQILADYLNEVFYGRHAYGAQAAAQTYFSKSASQLSLVQAALLAGLPQAPTTDDPVFRVRRRFEAPVLNIFERAYCSANFSSLSNPLSTRRRTASSASAVVYSFWISFRCSV